MPASSVLYRGARDLFNLSQEGAYATAARNPGELPTGFSEALEASWDHSWDYSWSLNYFTRRNQARRELADKMIEKSRGDEELRGALYGSDALGSYRFDWTKARERAQALQGDDPSLEIPSFDEDAVQRRADEIGKKSLLKQAEIGRRGLTAGGMAGSFLGSLPAGFADPAFLPTWAVAAGPSVGVLRTAGIWAGVTAGGQALVEAVGAPGRMRVDPHYGWEAATSNVIGAGAFGGVLGAGAGWLHGAAGGGFNWRRAKTSPDTPRNVRDAGNIVENEAQTVATNRYPGAEGEAAHRDALQKTKDDLEAGRPVDVSEHITPEREADYEKRLAPALEARRRAIAAGQKMQRAETDAVTLPVVEDHFNALRNWHKTLSNVPEPTARTLEEVRRSVSQLARNGYGLRLPKDESAKIAKQFVNLESEYVDDMLSLLGEDLSRQAAARTKTSSEAPALLLSDYVPRHVPEPFEAPPETGLLARMPYMQARHRKFAEEYLEKEARWPELHRKIVAEFYDRAQHPPESPLPEMPFWSEGLRGGRMSEGLYVRKPARERAPEGLPENRMFLPPDDLAPEMRQFLPPAYRGAPTGRRGLMEFWGEFMRDTRPRSSAEILSEMPLYRMSDTELIRVNEARQKLHAYEGRLNAKYGDSEPAAKWKKWTIEERREFARMFKDTQPRAAEQKLQAPAGPAGTFPVTLHSGSAVHPQLIGHYKPSTLFTKHEMELATAIDDVVTRIAPGAKVIPFARLDLSTKEAAAGGAYIKSREFPSLIAVSLDGARWLDKAGKVEQADALNIARHEAGHWLRRSGLFTDAEWSSLERAAVENNWHDLYNVRSRYKPLGLPEAQMHEEAIVEHFARWRGKSETPIPPGIRGLFERLRRFFNDVADEFKRAWENLTGTEPKWQDVFERIESGEVGRRSDGAVPDKTLRLTKSEPGLPEAAELTEHVRRLAGEFGHDMPPEEAANIAGRMLRADDAQARAILDEVMLRPRTVSDTLERPPEQQPTEFSGAARLPTRDLLGGLRAGVSAETALRGDRRAIMLDELRKDVTPQRIEELRYDPVTDESILRDLDRLRAERGNVEVPMGELVGPDGAVSAHMRRIDDVLAEADARIAAAREIAACAGPQEGSAVP